MSKRRRREWWEQAALAGALGAGAGLAAAALFLALDTSPGAWLPALLAGLGACGIVGGLALRFGRTTGTGVPAPTSFGDFVRAGLALLIIAGGGVFVWHMWHTPAHNGEKSLDPTIIITPALSLMAGITGYYFGTRGTDKANEALSVANETLTDKHLEVQDLRNKLNLVEDALKGATDRVPHRPTKEDLKRTLAQIRARRSA